MKKIVLIVAVLLSVLGALFAYNYVIAEINKEIREDTEDISQNTTRLSFIHWADFPEEIFSRFRERYPQIEVDYEQVNKQFYHDILKLRMASGNQLDIIGILRNDYDDFIIRGYLTNLSEKRYMKFYKKSARDELKKIPLSRKEYAIPYQSWVLGVWYNKILFNKYNIDIPKNFPELVKACKKLKEKGVDPIVLGARDEWVRGYIYLLRLYSLQENAEDWLHKIKIGEMKWTDPRIKSVFKDVNDFISEGYLGENSIYLTYHQAFADFMNGGSAMVIAGDWSLNLVSQLDERVCEPGVFPIPYNMDGEVLKVPGSRADFLIGIYSRSENEDIADLFLEHLSTPQIAQVFSEANKCISTVKAVREPSAKYNRIWKPLRNMERIPPLITNMDNEFLKLFNSSIEDLIIGEKDYTDILKKFQALQDELNRKRNR